MHEDIPYQCILEGVPTLSQEKEGSESPITSDSDAAPWRQRVQPSPLRVKKRQPIDVPKLARVKKSKRDKHRKKKKKETSSLSSSPSSWGEILHCSSSLSSKEEEYYSSPKQMHGKGKGKKAYDVKGRSKCYCKFKEGGKSITFLTYDGMFWTKYLHLHNNMTRILAMRTSPNLQSLEMHPYISQRRLVNGGQVFALEGAHQGHGRLYVWQ